MFEGPPSNFNSANIFGLNSMKACKRYGQSQADFQDNRYKFVSLGLLYTHARVCVHKDSNWGEHERAPHRRDKHVKICMYVCIYVCEFDTNFTYSDSDPLR